MTININVGIMGFSAQEERKFKKIFTISKNHERCYFLANTSEVTAVELLIVNTQDEFVTQQQQSYRERHKGVSIPVVNVGKSLAAVDGVYYIRGVLVPSRVLPILDNVEILPQNDDSIAEIKESDIKNQQDVEESDNLKNTNINAFLNVLVVDDSKMMQKTVQLELNKSTIPLATEFADSGEMALEKIAAKKYDFIFLDVMMPGIDGFETCTQIRKMEGMAKTPIIMLTSKTSALDEVKGLMAGCSTYLTKPFQQDEFQKTLEQIMHWVKEFNDGK
ncbi:MAG: response regulator [Methylococcaceae bacterium]|nr:response regulator [Methylococcaceae bacterium]